MEAIEFRIGNLIDVSNTRLVNPQGFVVLDRQLFRYFLEFPEEMGKVKAIPITEERLVRFGFTKGERWFGKEIFVNPKNTERSYFWVNLDGGYCICSGSDNSVVPDRSENSIHYLQNLYFALTGQELSTLK